MPAWTDMRMSLFISKFLQAHCLIFLIGKYKGPALLINAPASNKKQSSVMQMTGWLKQIRQEPKKLLCLSLWTEQMLSCQVFLCCKIQAEHPGKPNKKGRCLDWLLTAIWLTHWLALHSYWGNLRVKWDVSQELQGHLQLQPFLPPPS